MLVHPSEPVPEKQEQPKSDQLTALNNSQNASPGVLVLGKSSSLGARSDVITFLRYGHLHKSWNSYLHTLFCECVLINTITYNKPIWLYRNLVRARARALGKASKASKPGYRWSPYLEERWECEHLNKKWPLWNQGQQNMHTLRSGSSVPQGQSCGNGAFVARLRQNGRDEGLWDVKEIFVSWRQVRPVHWESTK